MNERDPGDTVLAPPEVAPARRIDSSRRIPALDGLRGIAILMVLSAHTVFHTTFQSHPALNRLVALGSLSFSGVDLFFVLSGFLIGGILLDQLDSPNYFKTFYLGARIGSCLFILWLSCSVGCYTSLA